MASRGAGSADEGDAGEAGGGGESMKARRLLRPVSEARLGEFTEKLRKTGVVYLSRVPPFMRPSKLRHLLETHGEVLHIYLTPEDAAAQRRRRKSGGNPSRKYTEGWVEFADKKVAKRVARGLNNTMIGGKKRDYYHDDIWNIRYLKGFKWHHLTERLAYERKIREQRIRVEMSQAKRQSKFYLDRVEQARSIDAQRAKKRARREKDGGDEPAPKIRRRFHQRDAVQTGTSEASADVLSRVLKGGKAEAE